MHHVVHQLPDRLTPVVHRHVRVRLTPQLAFDPVVVRTVRRQEVQPELLAELRQPQLGLPAAVFDSLKAAFLADSEVFFTALDGAKATAGSQGIAGNFTVVNFSRSEPIGEAMTADVELKPSSNTGWYTVA